MDKYFNTLQGRILADLLLEKEEFMVENDFAVDVLDHDPEGLALPVHLLVPLEVGRQGQLHPSQI